MLQITADIIHNGIRFLPQNTVIHVGDDLETIININDLKDNTPHIHFGGLLIPGMINAHCHLELSHLHHQFTKNMGLVNFLLDIIKNRTSKEIAEIKKSVAFWDKKMYEGGVVAVGDICNTIDTYEVKQNSKIKYHNFIECFGLKSENTKEILNKGIAIMQKLNESHPCSLVLHAPYSINQALIHEIDIASIDKITSIHNQECAAENQLFENQSGDFFRLFEFFNSTIESNLLKGKSSLQSLFPMFLHQKNMILVHNTFSSKEDIHFVEQSGKKIYWCTCPNANIFIENKLPNIPLWDIMGCNIVIGTDSLASNDDLNMWNEISTIYNNFHSISLEKILSWACYEGACALGLNSTLGTIEKNKKPGLVNIRNITWQDINMRKPISCFTSQLVKF